MQYTITKETSVNEIKKQRADSVKTSSLRKTFYKVATTNWSYDLYTRSKVLDETNPIHFFKFFSNA